MHWTLEITSLSRLSFGLTSHKGIQSWIRPPGNLQPLVQAQLQSGGGVFARERAIVCCK